MRLRLAVQSGSQLKRPVIKMQICSHHSVAIAEDTPFLHYLRHCLPTDRKAILNLIVKPNSGGSQLSGKTNSAGRTVEEAVKRLTNLQSTPIEV